MKLALLTCEDMSGFVNYDEELITELGKLGIEAKPVIWSNPADWAQYDGCLIRTPWDYTRKLPQFLGVLEGLVASGCPLANPLSTVKWNANKSYLKELAKKGAPIIPTLFFDKFSEFSFSDAQRELSAEKLILKPTVGANADHTYVLETEPPDICYFSGNSFMAQAFVESVLTEGEMSFFFFGGEYSHAVRKRPKAGDYRVQEEHGGEISNYQPTDHDLIHARKVLEAVEKTMLYARVDMVRDSQSKPMLMELELIEPSLYFPYAPGSAERFAKSIAAWDWSQL